MLNNPDTAPSASINCWIVSILTFHFELRHVPGKQHGPDGLSRRPLQPEDVTLDEGVDTFDDWVDNLYGFVYMINNTTRTPQSTEVLHILTAERAAIPAQDSEDEHDDLNLSYVPVPRTPVAEKADLRLVQAHEWLRTLQRPEDITDCNYDTLVRFATGFFTDKGHLWKRDPQGAHKRVLYNNGCIAPRTMMQTTGATTPHTRLPLNATGGHTWDTTSPGTSKHATYAKRNKCAKSRSLR